jgi:hypothetical protein
LPSHRIHRMVERALLGREYPDVHRILDLPAYFVGKSHRRYLHDPLTAYLVGYALHGHRGGLASLLHIIVDRVYGDRRARRLRALR